MLAVDYRRNEGVKLFWMDDHDGVLNLAEYQGGFNGKIEHLTNKFWKDAKLMKNEMMPPTTRIWPIHTRDEQLGY